MWFVDPICVAVLVKDLILILLRHCRIVDHILQQGWLQEIIHVLVVGFRNERTSQLPPWFCDNDNAIISVFNTVPP